MKKTLEITLCLRESELYTPLGKARELVLHSRILYFILKSSGENWITDRDRKAQHLERMCLYLLRFCLKRGAVQPVHRQKHIIVTAMKIKHREATAPEYFSIFLLMHSFERLPTRLITGIEMKKLDGNNQKLKSLSFCQGWLAKQYCCILMEWL